MDTRFWGPSGWIFLHQITFAYEPTRKEMIQDFFETLPFVLPCKFCRASLSQYMKDDPITDALSSQAKFTEWLYRIHNQVNDKLRNQGQPVPQNPTFDSVKRAYEESLASGCTQTFFPGWNFLFSIAENHPYAKENLHVSPMPDAPPRNPGMTDIELNFHNLLTPAERMPYYSKFWKSLGDCLPFPDWIQTWNRLRKVHHLDSAIQKRWNLLRCLWKMRCEMEAQFELKGKTKFADLCQVLAEHRSGCARSKKAITCRKSRSSKRRKTIKS